MRSQPVAIAAQFSSLTWRCSSRFTARS